MKSAPKAVPAEPRPSRHGTIEIKTMTGNVNVPVEHKAGDFALHRVSPNSKKYTITHIPTGAGVGSLVGHSYGARDGKRIVNILAKPKVTAAINDFVKSPSAENNRAAFAAWNEARQAA